MEAVNKQVEPQAYTAELNKDYVPFEEYLDRLIARRLEEFKRDIVTRIQEEIDAALNGVHYSRPDEK